MAGSSFGKSFVVTTFGESHGVALGAIVDGVPAGIELSEEEKSFWTEENRDRALLPHPEMKTTNVVFIPECLAVKQQVHLLW